MEAVYEIELKLSTGTGGASSLFTAVQGDKGTRKIVASLLNENGTPYTIDSGVTAAYWSRKPDKTGTQHSDGVTISGSTVTVILTEQDLAAPGRVYAAIELLSGEEVLTAIPFYFTVAEKPVGQNVDSTNDYQRMIEAIDRIDEVIEGLPDDFGNLVETVEALETDKADSTGTYEDLTSGLSLQMASDVYTEDQTPYLHRRSAGGDRCFEELVGGTVVWNQIANRRNYDFPTTASASYWKTVTALGSPMINEHKYFCSVKITRNLSENNAISVLFGGNASGRQIPLRIYNTDPNGVYQIVGTSNNFENATVICVNTYVGKKRFDEGDEVRLENIMTIDLTAMFGSTIADYVYGLEQSVAGSGVQWLKDRGFFVKDYYDYDPGTLRSVQASGKKCVGFNLFDKTNITVGKYITSSGEEVSNSSIYHTNYIRVMSNTLYHTNAVISGDRYAVHLYDQNKNHIGYIDQLAGGLFNTGNASYIIINSFINTGSADSLALNLSDPTRNGEYEPYTAHTYDFDSDLELRGIPKLDANNELYYDGDTYDADGKVTRRYGVVDLGTLSWTYDTANTRFRTQSKFTVAKGAGEILALLYRTTTYGNTANTTMDKVIGIHAESYIAVRDSSYTDAAAFKAAMSGVLLVYELATPTTETADPYQSPQICDEYGTEEFIDTRAVPIPVGHYTKYPTNQRKKLDGLPSDFSTLIAMTEKSATATVNHAVGTYFILNNVLYKTTSAIAVGGTITPGSNCIATTIMAELSALA